MIRHHLCAVVVAFTCQAPGGFDRNNIFSQPNSGIGDRNHSRGHTCTVQFLNCQSGCPTGPRRMEYIPGREKCTPLGWTKMMVYVNSTRTLARILCWRLMDGEKHRIRARVLVELTY